MSVDLEQYIGTVRNQFDRDRKTFALDMLAIDYHGYFTRGIGARPLVAASRDEWVARFRAMVGPEGFKFPGWPGPGYVIRLWRGTQREEHKDGLSWTASRSIAAQFASMGEGPGQVWRIDSVPMQAVLYYEPVMSLLNEFLIDTTGLDIVREQ
jgi:hypothetical protein